MEMISWSENPRAIILATFSSSQVGGPSGITNSGSNVDSPSTSESLIFVYCSTARVGAVSFTQLRAPAPPGPRRGSPHRILTTFGLIPALTADSRLSWVHFAKVEEGAKQARIKRKIVVKKQISRTRDLNDQSVKQHPFINPPCTNQRNRE